ncbi:MAG: class I SAM-dependent methyltransferase [Candidatus Korarchaeota archaeon]|nr:class I SAM-dependent methyltransferase [Candidatus Korarchaeota archaeon]NIU82496.1 class I SAM-dependent methyltransferase [Candidatus Thorarchaeota archaeon]NIW12984.1 class I SAM-dependent methyltransferase [Candidatus Thorarchaeota archaeon]NIW51134.1 class I SAM-dependent methyltransferase [Candidatus Korarchaeota archaeon]
MHKFAPNHADILERTQRFSELSPERIFEILPPCEGDTVLDVGAGTGYLTFPLSEKVGRTGKIYAIDVQEAMLDKLRDKMSEKGLENIEVVKSREDHIPLDNAVAHKCYCSNVLHELQGKGTLQEVYRILQPLGKLCIIDWKKVRGRRGPPVHERLSKSEATKLIESVGCEVTHVTDIGKHHFLIMAKKNSKKRENTA